MEKQIIIELAYHYLKNELGNHIKWQKTQVNTEWDAIFNMNDQIVFVIVKNEIRPHQVEQFFRQKKKAHNFLVAANYITPAAKKLIKEKGINYIDRAGNMFFKVTPVYLYIEGKPNQPPTEDRKNRAFTKTGTKVVFQILLDTNLVNATYRELAEKANVALGTIPKVIEGLKEEGYLLMKNKNERLLTNFHGLLNRWQHEYTKRLKPILFIKRFRPADKDFRANWEKLKLGKNTEWGGEPAADILTGYLKPQNFIIYTNQTIQELMKTNRWIPDAEGEIFVYRKFWETPKKNENETAPAPLIYADLVETGDSRCIETAKLIYEKYLQEHS